MMDERKEEMAALYALGILEAREVPAFEEEMRNDAVLRKLVDDLTHDAASLAHVVPFQEAPADLREKILLSIHGLEADASGASLPSVKSQGGGGNVVPFRRQPVAWFPWAIAAGFAVMCGLLFRDHVKLKDQIVSLQNQSDICQMQVTMLGSMNGNSPHGIAVVIWDPSTQTGVLKAENMPRPAANEDYQLWAVDPRDPAQPPVNAGVIAVDEYGAARATFKPVQHTGVSKFAVSIEPKGGVQQHDKGPIVMISK